MVILLLGKIKNTPNQRNKKGSTTLLGTRNLKDAFEEFFIMVKLLLK